MKLTEKTRRQRAVDASWKKNQDTLLDKFDQDMKDKLYNYCLSKHLIKQDTEWDYDVDDGEYSIFFTDNKEKKIVISVRLDAYFNLNQWKKEEEVRLFGNNLE